MARAKMAKKTKNTIGSVNESSLHETVKALYARARDKRESMVGGYIVDIVKKGGLLVEIQTRHFSKLKSKLSALLPEHRIKLVYPIAVEKTLVVHDASKVRELYRRKSPKKGVLVDIVDELIHIPSIAAHPNFSLDVLLTREEETRSADGGGSWRRRGVSIVDRKLLEVVDRVEFNHARDYLALLPDGLPGAFTNRTVAENMHLPVWKAARLTYCLRSMGLLRVVGKRGNAHLFAFETESQG